MAEVEPLEERSGEPLYAYVLDRQAGQTNGEGSFAFGARWYAVSARGKAVLKVRRAETGARRGAYLRQVTRSRR